MEVRPDAPAPITATLFPMVMEVWLTLTVVRFDIYPVGFSVCCGDMHTNTAI